MNEHTDGYIRSQIAIALSSQRSAWHMGLDKAG